MSDRLYRLMLPDDTDRMAPVITDEMLDVYAVTSTWADLPAALVRRYDGIVQRVFSYLGWESSPEMAARWADVARQVKFLGGSSLPTTLAGP